MSYQQSEIEFIETDFELTELAEVEHKMHVNSLDAYRKMILPELTVREMECFIALKELNEATVSEVAVYMNTFPHCISGRFTALKEKNKIRTIGIKKIGRSRHDILTINNV